MILPQVHSLFALWVALGSSPSSSTVTIFGFTPVRVLIFWDTFSAIEFLSSVEPEALSTSTLNLVVKFSVMAVILYSPVISVDPGK